MASPAPNGICSVQSEAMQILQSVDPSSQSLVNQVLSNIEQTVRQTILDILMSSSANKNQVEQIKSINQSLYNQLLNMIGLVDNGSGMIQVNQSSSNVQDFCSLQSQMVQLINNAPPSVQQILLGLIASVTYQLKQQVPGLITQLLLQNKNPLMSIFEQNPTVGSQLLGLVNQYANVGMLSAFGK